MEKIASVFIERGAYLDRFLHLRLNCFSAQGRHFAMLKDSKSLYELTGDLGVARNIIALLYEQNERAKKEYEPYISALRDSDIPSHAIAVCSAAMRFGDNGMAERYAYKALYLLDGQDDYEIYKSYFNYVNSFVLSHPKELNFSRISDNTVVVLQENNKENRRIVCLDSESEFCNEDNHSLGIDHLRKGDLYYTKIVNGNIGQIINVFGTLYRIVECIPREAYAVNFICKKVKEHPEQFDGVVQSFSSDDPQKLIEQIRNFSQTENVKHVLECYHFEGVPYGIPIEMLSFGDYSKYIDCLKYLLYAPDQALYAGGVDLVNELSGQYIPTLSTLDNM